MDRRVFLKRSVFGALLVPSFTENISGQPEIHKEISRLERQILESSRPRTAILSSLNNIHIVQANSIYFFKQQNSTYVA
ncbi:hypothetical protein HYS31_06910 [Candidatus Woesearchaeota archaeon]|nr:hypothetical protein [Candidatus Woesearchaeota archaeon]